MEIIKIDLNALIIIYLINLSEYTKKSLKSKIKGKKMRIKTIEKLFPLEQCYESIKPYIKSQYKIDENSYISGSNLLLLGIASLMDQD